MKLSGTLFSQLEVKIEIDKLKRMAIFFLNCLKVHSGYYLIYYAKLRIYSAKTFKTRHGNNCINPVVLQNPDIWPIAIFDSDGPK